MNTKIEDKIEKFDTIHDTERNKTGCVYEIRETFYGIVYIVMTYNGLIDVHENNAIKIYED